MVQGYKTKRKKGFKKLDKEIEKDVWLNNLLKSKNKEDRKKLGRYIKKLEKGVKELETKRIEEEIRFVNCERSITRTALNLLWDENVKRKFAPLKIKDDQMLNKYHAWCRIQEKDKMSDFYWIQKVRNKLKRMERNESTDKSDKEKVK